MLEDMRRKAGMIEQDPAGLLQVDAIHEDGDRRPLLNAVLTLSEDGRGNLSGNGNATR